MMDFAAQRLLAKVDPVRLGIGQMQVPNLIDRVGGGYTRFGSATQKNKLFVLLDYPQGIAFRPAVFASNPVRKGEFNGGVTELKPLNFSP